MMLRSIIRGQGAYAKLLKASSQPIVYNQAAFLSGKYRRRDAGGKFIESASEIDEPKPLKVIREFPEQKQNVEPNPEPQQAQSKPSTKSDNSQDANIRISIGQRYVPFEEEKQLILDIHEEQLRDEAEEQEFYLYQQKSTNFRLGSISKTRGVEGVFDLEELVDILKQEKLQDVAVITIPRELKYADYLVIVSAMSERHLEAVNEFLIKAYKWKKNRKDKFVEKDTFPSKDWKCLDFGNIVVHLMLPQTRQFYDIETLWCCGSDHDDLTQRPPEDAVIDALTRHMQLIQELEPDEQPRREEP